jgi:hypothetical protein
MYLAKATLRRGRGLLHFNRNFNELSSKILLPIASATGNMPTYQSDVQLRSYHASTVTSLRRRSGGPSILPPPKERRASKALSPQQRQHEVLQRNNQPVPAQQAQPPATQQQVRKHITC